MLCVHVSCHCSLHASGEEARFTPRSTAYGFRRWKSPACFLFSQQLTTPAQESLRLWNKWPNDAGLQPAHQDVFSLWNKWPIETTNQGLVAVAFCSRIRRG
ncbi:hypothetical protein L7F22_041847 [Adiantum nelumboides]|nr:hypothetical protein [Adiantum nelumboides]